MPIDPPSSKSESKAKDGSEAKETSANTEEELNRQSIGKT